MALIRLIGRGLLRESQTVPSFVVQAVSSRLSSKAAPLTSESSRGADPFTEQLNRRAEDELQRLEAEQTRVPQPSATEDEWVDVSQSHFDTHSTDGCSKQPVSCQISYRLALGAWHLQVSKFLESAQYVCEAFQHSSASVVL